MNKANIIIKLSDALSFEMIYIEGGSYMMGDDQSDLLSEKPAHRVKIERFYLGQYQVTQNLWQAIMDTDPSTDKGAMHPIDNISWEDAKEFIEKLNQRTKKIFRLPSESEWEYAARGGIYSRDYIYSGSDKLSQVGWYNKNSNGTLQKVGQKLANELGLYDMSGNIDEWCEDDWHGTYDGARRDGSAWVDTLRSVNRVVRGGNWLNPAEFCRSAYRIYVSSYFRSNIGFRLAMSLQSFEVNP